MGEKLVLLDGYSLMYRAFHALSTPMTAPDGTPTNAVHGFVMMLLRVLDEEAPTAAAVAFDVEQAHLPHRSLRRLQGQPQAHARGTAPAGPRHPRSACAHGPARHRMRGLRGRRHIGHALPPVRGDAAWKPCSSPATAIPSSSPATTPPYCTQSAASPRRSASPPRGCEETYGVSPAQLIDVKGLMGDASDNIPGVPGVGEKTALRLIAQYGDLEHVLAGADAGEKGRLRERLLENADLARLSRTLATIRRDVPVSLDLENWRLSGLGGGIARLRELGMNQAAAPPCADGEGAGAAAPAPAAPASASGGSDSAVETPENAACPRRAPRGAGRHGEARRRLYWNGIFRRHGRGAPAHAAGRRSHRSRHWRGGGARSGAAAACLRSAQGALRRQGAGRSCCPRPGATPSTPCSPPMCSTRSAPRLICGRSARGRAFPGTRPAPRPLCGRCASGRKKSWRRMN